MWYPEPIFFFSMASSSSSSSSSSTSVRTTFFVATSLPAHQFNTPFSLKLNDENFLIWKKQVLATLRGLDLMHFLDNNHTPSEFLQTSETPLTENPTFRSYHKQDQLIVAWLLAAMTSPLLTKMVGLETSRQIWHRLLTHYASHTRAMVKKFRMLLKTPKNDRSISAYLNDIKKVADSLVAVGSPLSTVDHIDVILNGLSADFDGFITSVLSRSDPYSVDDLEALLLAQAARFDKHKLSHDTLLQVNTVSTPTPWQFKTQNKKKFHSILCVEAALQILLDLAFLVRTLVLPHLNPLPGLLSSYPVRFVIN